MNCEKRVSVNPKQVRMKLDTHGLEVKILEWVQTHDWYRIEVVTNGLKLKRQFRGVIGYINWQLERHNRQEDLQYLNLCWNRLTQLCRPLDRICRKGCDTEEEWEKLQSTHGRVINLATFLSERIKAIQESVEKGEDTWGREAEWITHTEAANLLSVSKSTISRWVDKGVLIMNHQKGRKKRINKASVIIWEKGLKSWNH